MLAWPRTKTHGDADRYFFNSSWEPPHGSVKGAVDAAGIGLAWATTTLSAHVRATTKPQAANSATAYNSITPTHPFVSEKCSVKMR